MALGTSLSLIAVGAILRYAVSDSLEGIDIPTIGLILMIVGIVGMLISLFTMTLWDRDRRRGGVVEERRVSGRGAPYQDPFACPPDRPPPPAATVVTVCGRDRCPRPARRRGALDRRPAVARGLRADGGGADRVPAGEPARRRAGRRARRAAHRRRLLRQLRPDLLDRRARRAARRAAARRRRGAHARGVFAPARARRRDGAPLRDRHGPSALRASRLRGGRHRLGFGGDGPPRERAPLPGPPLRPARDDDRAAIRALDRAATGEDRAAVLDALDPLSGLVAERAGEP